MSDNEFPKLVYTDFQTPAVTETFPGSGVFCKSVADKDEEKAAVSDGFRLTVEKKAKRVPKKAK